MYETGRVPREGVLGIWDRLVNLSEQIPMWLILLTTRIGIAMIFLKYGMTKTTTGLNLADGTFTLFEYEYVLPVIPSDIAAYLATYAEHIFPILLILGLFGRLSALSLLGMTLVIQIFVYPNLWDIHLFWAGALLLLVAKGPGAVSLDAIIVKFMDRK
jgi:putative oxidoreductase